MVQLPNIALPEPASTKLIRLQSEIDKIPKYQDKVAAAKKAFSAKNTQRNRTFRLIKETLCVMCSGAQRCCYCEDSAADEVEHIRPKDLYPEEVFVWENYLYACGPCNGPKNNRFAVFDASTGIVTEVTRKSDSPVVRPITGEPVLINPRRENPLHFFELDLLDTFEFVPAFGLDHHDRERAIYTRKVLRLNERDLLVQARKTAYGSYVARLKEFVAEKVAGASAASLALFVQGLQRMDHPTVWREIQRQHVGISVLDGLFTAAPEALTW